MTLKLLKIAIKLRKYKLNKMALFLEGLIFIISGARISSDIILGEKTRFAYNGMSCLIVKGTVIGKSCLIGARVTTGRKFPYKKVPKIGDSVFIGFNSSIIGPIEIGDNVVIAPHTLVNKNVPEGSIVAGDPFKIIGNTDSLNYNIFENEQYL